MRSVKRPEEEMRNNVIDWEGSIANDWNIVPLYSCLGEINQKNTPIVTHNILSLTNTEGVIPYSERGNQGNKAKESVEDYKVVYPETIVANSMNILIGSVGLSKYEGCVSPVYYVYKAKGQNDIRYLNYIFQTERFQKKLRQYANGILEIRLRVSSHNILHQKLALPPVAEQHAIADYLDDRCAQIDALIAEAKDSIEEYKALKQSVIYQAVTKGLDKNVPMKDSGIEWIGVYPEHWNVEKISYIGQTSSGSTPLRSHEKEFFDDANIRWVRTLDLNDDHVTDSSEKITEIAMQNSSCKLMPIGTVCVAMYGGGGTIGKCGLLDYEATTNQAVCSIVCDETKMFPEYLLNQMLAIKKYWMKFAVGTRKDPNISQQIISSMKVLVPPLKEQKAISKYLVAQKEKLDSLISEKQSLIDDLTSYKQSLIYECVTGKRKVVD